MVKRRNKTHFDLNEPLRHSHRPVTRRDFIAQGFRAGTATLMGTSMMGLLAPKASAIDPNIYDLIASGYPGNTCNLNVSGGQKIPFICFDLAGGANIAGSNVLVGQRGGQQDFLSEAGYSKLGIAQDRVPNNGQVNTIDESLGLAFHSDSAMLAGINQSMSDAAKAATNGAVLPARSDNDTGNNPHNPLYGIYQSGARGSLLNLIGSENTESGGNSMAPLVMIDPEVRPTKIDRAADVSGLVDVGDLSSVLSDPNDVVSVMERMASISKMKLDVIDPGMGGSTDNALRARILCEYMRAADTYEKFSNPAALDVFQDTQMFGSTGIFDAADFSDNRNYETTAAVAKLVVDSGDLGVIGGRAAAGSITLGGYDYHTGDRVTGEMRDLVAGRCIGACLEYAHRREVPIMVYVFSDGSVASNGMIDPMANKPQWTGDNSSTAASYFLVYNPPARGGRPTLNTSVIADPFQHQQIGWMRSDASVETSATPASNSVNQLVYTVLLNYMALHDDISGFSSIFTNNGLGAAGNLEQYVAFNPII